MKRSFLFLCPDWNSVNLLNRFLWQKKYCENRCDFLYNLDEVEIKKNKKKKGNYEIVMVLVMVCDF